MMGSHGAAAAVRAPGLLTARERVRSVPIWRRPVAGAIALLLLSVNMRTAIASVGPLVPQIRADLGLSSLLESLLVTAPVICFAVFAPIGPIPARRFGVERTLCGVLLISVIGLFVRVGPNTFTLFLGTVLVGSAIAIANVLVPGLIKRDYPDRVGLMTGVYTTALGLGATVAAATTVPLARAFGHGWRGGLLFWVLPVLLALVVWLPRAVRARHTDEGLERAHFGPLLRDRIAWQVTVYTATQSIGYYAVVSWLPTLFIEHGYTATTAGLIFALSSLTGTVASLVAPTLAARRREQRLALAGAALLTALGFAGLLVAPTAAPWLWAVVLGVGQGAGFPLALTVMGLRTRTPEQTQELSAMAQTFGYLFAITGPLIVGVLRSVTGSWSAGLVFLIILSGVQLGSGLVAGRDQLVLAPRPPGTPA
jgi:MFS transporter, CP family, cyanate transporter